MSVNPKHSDRGAYGLDGPDSQPGFIPVSFFWEPTVADSCFFVADRAYRVRAIRARVEVVGACTTTPSENSGSMTKSSVLSSPTLPLA